MRDAHESSTPAVLERYRGCGHCPLAPCTTDEAQRRARRGACEAPPFPRVTLPGALPDDEVMRIVGERWRAMAAAYAAATDERIRLALHDLSPADLRS